MTLAANPPTSPEPSRVLPAALRRLLRRRTPAPPDTPELPDAPEALVQALCHDMRSPLASLEALLEALGHAGPSAGPAPDPGEVLELARAQTAHLASMLRTAAATGGAAPLGRGTRRLGDVVRASVSASGLPDAQLTLELGPGTEDVAVADARVQRILTNLLENAHRHGAGAAVRLSVRCRPGWVDLALTQAVVRPERLLGHLRTEAPPPDLTGLGLWSVRRQTGELGGRIVADDDGESLRLTVQLPDR
ncbi:two-component system, OmpR family, sensor histidine kinase KdpD [Geodermatophilus obscurus]|uniref:histidine kinase n=1 Tax=Geodermatophilus obscurus TaxID=1861 RepID=A0A1M7UYX4_9ACTN|nr:HAMP domain-containing sensor histidine kinase [Geodermatophilus obscurus]SHN88135.1 two-component system, OmpR family, sensor histidine kinase KdpD [Geodermatophilus obscurus]